MKIKEKTIISGEELSKEELISLLNLASQLKKEKGSYSSFLKNKSIALIFDKPSLRTRFSFTAAVHQLGGQVIESFGDTRKSEQPKDFIRVIQGYCDALVIRTDEDIKLTQMKPYSVIPIINGLTDRFHPCQILSDFLTLQERGHEFSKLVISYVGDGNNILHSLLLMGSKLDIEIRYCCPKSYGPDIEIIKLAKGKITSCQTPEEAVKGSHAVYTDVWTSMGFAEKDESLFEGYQVNSKLMNYAVPGAVFMHCMPMIRGKEVSDELPDTGCSVIFKQSENRLFVQQALLIGLMN